MALHDKLGDPGYVHLLDALVARLHFPSKKVQHGYKGSIVIDYGCVLQLVLDS
jgi:hypothetical protein